MQDRIEKSIEIEAPVGRVWRALTDHREFGAWFRVDLDGPFTVGEVSRGRMTYPGYEGMRWEVTIIAIEPERRFAFSWCPYADNPDRDYTLEPQTEVESATGTRVHITESGFAGLPDDPRRTDALRDNDEGWDVQAKNLASHVAG